MQSIHKYHFFVQEHNANSANLKADSAIVMHICESYNNIIVDRIREREGRI